MAVYGAFNQGSSPLRLAVRKRPAPRCKGKGQSLCTRFSRVCVCVRPSISCSPRVSLSLRVGEGREVVGRERTRRVGEQEGWTYQVCLAVSAGSASPRPESDHCTHVRTGYIIHRADLKTTRLSFSFFFHVYSIAIFLILFFLSSTCTESLLR